MSINQLFEISRRSLLSIDAAINVTGQNIANARTPGYKRRRIALSSASMSLGGAQTGSVGLRSSGLGVSVSSIDRVRDGLLTAAANDSKTALSTADEEYRVLTALEGIMPTDTGSIQNMMGNLWNAWGDLANNPTDLAPRNAIISSAQTMVDGFRRISDGLAQIDDQTRVDLTNGVAEFNDIVKQIATLNGAIQANGGSGSLGLEDERDILMSRLSEFAPIDVDESGAGGFTVTIHGMMVVQGSEDLGLQIDNTGATPVVQFAGTNIAFNPPDNMDGKIGAWQRMLTNELPQLRTDLDALVNTLVTEVNNVHTTGFGQDGVGGRDFFDPAGLTLGTIAIDAGILASPDTIAASGDVAAAGDNSVALGISDLRTALLMNGGTDTFEEYAIGVSSGLGSKIYAAGVRYESQSVVASQLDAMEAGLSGVSLEEEMSSLIEYQQSFSAASRILQTAQTLMDTILNL